MTTCDITGWIRIPAGSFIMGDVLDGPAHPVVISRAFQVRACPVTVAEYRRFDPRATSHLCSSPDCPVVNVSWYDCQRYIQWFNEHADQSLQPCRLPTEAEWEYACRAGAETNWSCGNDVTRLQTAACYGANSGGACQPVGLMQPNPWGLFDMHGLVMEWVQDWHGPYSEEKQLDPVGPSSGMYKVYRGGDWYFFSGSCRSSARSFNLPTACGYGLGFRLVRPEPPDVAPVSRTPNFK